MTHIKDTSGSAAIRPFVCGTPATPASGPFVCGTPSGGGQVGEGRTIAQPVGDHQSATYRPFTFPKIAAGVQTGDLSSGSDVKVKRQTLHDRIDHKRRVADLQISTKRHQKNGKLKRKRRALKDAMKKGLHEKARKLKSSIEKLKRNFVRESIAVKKGLNGTVTKLRIASKKLALSQAKKRGNKQRVKQLQQSIRFIRTESQLRSKNLEARKQALLA